MDPSLWLSSDDLPMRGFIGHLEEGSFLPHNHKTYLWTHLHFSFGYNGNEVRCLPLSLLLRIACGIFLGIWWDDWGQVVEANVSTVGALPLSLDQADAPLKITFTYSVQWSKSLCVTSLIR